MSIEDSSEVPQVWRLGSEGSWTSHNGVFCKLSGGRDDFLGGRHGVLIWPDAFSLRAAMRDIAKRIAAEGYSVLVPNPFYRVAKAPVFQDVSNFDFQNPTDRAKLQPLTGSINAPGAAEKDASAYSA